MTGAFGNGAARDSLGKRALFSSPEDAERVDRAAGSRASGHEGKRALFSAPEEPGTANPDARTVTELCAQAVRSVPRMTQAATKLAGELFRIAIARAPVEASPEDSRFADVTWTENPAFRALRQAYLAWSDAVMEFADAPGMDARAADRARFAATRLTSRLAPTNFFFTDPAALKRAFDTGGSSVVHRLRNMTDDRRRNDS